MPPPREERFEGLFRATYPAVRAYALRRSAPEAAKDVVAETFLVAWRRLDEVPEDALPWLYGTESTATSSPPATSPTSGCR
jgi:RNA polymerase sigma-70 factor (ECF subfamily)